MFNKKHLLLISLVICVLFAISSVAASNLNETDVVCEDQIDESIVLETCDENLNMDVIASPNSADVLNSTDDDIISKEISVESDSKLSTNYADAYFEPITTKYNSGEMFYFGWSGYFDGDFKVYKGKSLIHEEYLEGYDADMEWGLEGLAPGTYTAKLITYNGITLGSGKIVIQKSSSKISVKSFKATAGSKFYCYAYVKDKFTGRNYDGGTVKFKINGKTYAAALVEGVAIAKIKIPSKVKKFTCTASFGGGGNVYGSSTKFTITVKKKPVYKTITIKTKMSDTKYVTKYYGKYKIQTFKFKHAMTTLCVFVYKNNNMLKKNQYSSKIQYKENGVWHWSKWLHGSDAAVYHKYFCDNSVTIGKVKVKFRVS